MYIRYLVKLFKLSPFTFLVQKWRLSPLIKPDIPKKPEIKIEYNNRSFESFIKNGFADAIPRSVYGPRDRMQKFLSLS